MVNLEDFIYYNYYILSVANLSRLTVKGQFLNAFHGKYLLLNIGGWI